MNIGSSYTHRLPVNNINSSLKAKKNTIWNNELIKFNAKVWLWGNSIYIHKYGFTIMYEYSQIKDT